MTARALSTPDRMVKLINAAESAGKQVFAARVEGRAIVLEFTDRQNEPINPADLVNMDE